MLGAGPPATSLRIARPALHYEFHSYFWRWCTSDAVSSLCHFWCVLRFAATQRASRIWKWNGYCTIFSDPDQVHEQKCRQGSLDANQSHYSTTADHAYFLRGSQWQDASKTRSVLSTPEARLLPETDASAPSLASRREYIKGHTNNFHVPSYQTESWQAHCYCMYLRPYDKTNGVRTERSWNTSKSCHRHGVSS